MSAKQPAAQWWDVYLLITPPVLSLMKSDNPYNVIYQIIVLVVPE